MQNRNTETESLKINRKDANADPLTGAAGAHPVGVGAGAAGGGLAGAAIGAGVGGPIGAAVGAVAGALAGGLAGKEAAELVNPTVEHAYWRKEFTTRPYFTHGTPYDQYAPAYKYGWESQANHKGKTFEDIETQLSSGWETNRGQSKLSWNHARPATLDAWQRAKNAACGNTCNSDE